MKEIEALQLTQKAEASSTSLQIKSLQSKLDQHAEERDVLKSQLTDVQKELQAAKERSKEVEAELERLHDDKTKSLLENELALAKAASKRLEQENQQLETRALEAEEKVSLLLDQVENSVDNYRRSIIPKRADGNSPPISPRSSSIDNRTSVALDSLAHELDQLRSHWESSSHRYRLSTSSSLGRESPTRATGVGLTSFDFETPRVTVDDSKVNGVHEHTSRWRDEIDTQPSHVRQVAA
jgi:chromosome segregation ATPase